MRQVDFNRFDAHSFHQSFFGFISRRNHSFLSIVRRTGLSQIFTKLAYNIKNHANQAFSSQTIRLRSNFIAVTGYYYQDRNKARWSIPVLS